VSGHAEMHIDERVVSWGKSVDSATRVVRRFVEIRNC
jgi:hypothetical protein